MAEEIAVFERQIAVNVVVGVVDVTLDFSAQEVIVMPAASLPGTVTALWEPKIASFSPLNGGSYEVDTRLGIVPVYLPLNPVNGFAFGLRDGYANFGVNALQLVPAVGSGHQIVQTTVPEEPLTLNYPHVGTGFLIRFRASDSTWSW